MATSPEAGAPEADGDVAHHTVPALAAGTELIGQYRGSGYREPPYLARRADGQVLQLSYLLHLVATHLDGRRTYEQLAVSLSNESGRGITPGQVSYLVENRLRRAGIVAADPESGGPEEAFPRSRDRLLALRFRVALVPARAVMVIARVFQPLFWPPVMVTAMAGFAFAVTWLALHGGARQVGSTAHALINRPEDILLVLGVLALAGIFHECGHVAACRYGGARPGPMGVGIYLVWPAMYSTVTDSYRLSRGGRLRTDFGGIYFNALAMLAMIVLYLQTQVPWLLAALVSWQAATLWQFLPSIRLDGYYILSDLVGVPDLFDRMGPTVRSLVPGRPLHPRVRELKSWVRWVITVWVLLVIPCLAYWLIAFLVLAPHVLPAVWRALLLQGEAVASSARAGEFAATAVGIIRIFLLVLPWAGIALTTTITILGLVRTLRTRRARHV
jgi:putative peptide zinc metalloprotease protein